MKVLSIYVVPAMEDTPVYVCADIEVEDLGKVTINNCLSIDTLSRMYAEAEASLRVKLGQAVG